MNVVVLGSKGMLGKAVVEEGESRGYLVSGYERGQFSTLNWWSPKPDLIINCAGKIPLKSLLVEDMIRDNSMLPVTMARTCEKQNIPFIHVSTDCVFSGSRQATYLYRRDDIPDASDLYGRSKSVGESAVDYGAMVLRTSFIGLDHGLLAWLLDHKGGKVEGWIHAYWSGSTVWEVAKQLFNIDYKPGIYHLATELVHTKASVLERLREILNIDVEIEPTPEPRINRGLYPDYSLRYLDDQEVVDCLLAHYRGGFDARE